jgi:proteic killer suppression protein
MEAEFDDPILKRLWADPNHNAGLGQPLVKAFRKKMQAIIAATDERDLYQMRSLHFERLKGKRDGQHSLRLNDQWRLIVELRGEGRGKRVGVVEIVDYH